MHTPRSKTSSHNGAYNGSLDVAPKPTHDVDGYIGKEFHDPFPVSYADKNGQLEVILNCFKHYTRIDQADVGKPDADLTCLKCIKGNGVW